MSVQRVQADEGNEQALIDKARAAREAEKPRIEAEREANLANTRKRAQEMGVMRTSPNGFERLRVQRGTIDQSNRLMGGQQSIKIGPQLTSVEAARNANLIDDAGNLTERGRELAARGSDSPAGAQQRTAAADPLSISGTGFAGRVAESFRGPDASATRPGHERLSGFEFVALKRGADLANVSEREVQAIIGQLRNPRVHLGPTERTAAERDARRLESELARRRGDVDAIQEAEEPDVGADATESNAGNVVTTELVKAVQDRIARHGGFDVRLLERSR